MRSELAGGDVSKPGSRIPKKLKRDAIVEAVFEVRFSTVTQPEFLIVRLSEFEPWKAFTQARLPAYSIPENIRMIDPNFRYQPTYELMEPSNRRSVRIGPSVLSYHMRQPYEGWSKFHSELQEAIGKLFSSAERPVINRLGLRYINVFSPELHGIRGIGDLDVSLKVACASVTSKVNVNFISSVSAQTIAAVRIASPEFILPKLPLGAAVFADIDVSTTEGFEATTKGSVLEWLDSAHTAEKQQFFCLLTDETIARLEEK